MPNVIVKVVCHNCGDEYAYKPWEDEIRACPDCTSINEWR